MSVRLSYADINNNGSIEPASEILEENNYSPFGLKHQGYNELAGDAHKYKFLNKEYQPELGLNTIATDYRHYDAALGRFNSMDALSELAPNQTPYRYGFNNPVYWTDPTGLFETYGAAKAFAMEEGIKDGTYRIDALQSGGYVLSIISGEFEGYKFYDGANYIEELEIDGSGGGGGNLSIFQGPGTTPIEKFWNSPMMRLTIPDKISFGIAGEWAYFVGIDVNTFNFTLLTRGEAGIYYTPNINVRAGVGSYVSGGVNFSTGLFTGNPSNITASMLQGHTAGVVLTGTYIGKASLGASYSFTDKSGIGFINSEVSVGLGAGPAAGAGGFGGVQYQYTPGVGTIWKWY